VFFVFVVSGLFSSVLRHALGWKGLKSDLFCVEWDIQVSAIAYEPTRCITANALQTKMDTQCDKFATKLS